ncbi:MAG: helix-turn-helix domain-containing protein [Egibacteraceae bacterium]
MKQSKNKKHADVVPASLGEFIRRAREKRNISVRRLAEELHMHHSYIARVEAGVFKQPPPEKLQRIAQCLELDYDDLCALAGYQAPGLPALLPYLRAKYKMSDAHARYISECFDSFRDQHGITERTHDTDNKPKHVS